MTNRTVVIRKQSSVWQRKTKRKIQPILEIKSHTAGFISPVFVVFVSAIFCGLFYVYLVNQTAIKGIAIRNAEKEIEEQMKNNEILKIKEAELKSLYKIEEQSKQMEMINVSQVKYLEDNSSVALNSNPNLKKNK
ncbi:MAG TPA: hypothetical protein PLB52_01085 [Candidatus Moranbacteria bacterium]|nr:hypothetical protein [Candidatus Moranbacteria bacterium]